MKWFGLVMLMVVFGCSQTPVGLDMGEEEKFSKAEDAQINIQEMDVAQETPDVGAVTIFDDSNYVPYDTSGWDYYWNHYNYLNRTIELRFTTFRITNAADVWAVSVFRVNGSLRVLTYRPNIHLINNWPGDLIEMPWTQRDDVLHVDTIVWVRW